MFGLNANLFRSDRRRSPKGTFKPQFEALEQREVMSVVTSGVLVAPPTSVLAHSASVLANPAITAQTLPPGWVFDGEFNGNTAVDVMSTPAPNTRPAKTTVQTLNVKDLLFGLYNNNLATTTNAITNYLGVPANTGGHRLYDIRLSLPAANPPDFLSLYVNTKQNLFGFVYTSEPCALNCKVDSGHSYEPDPSMQVTFNLVLSMSFTTNGAPPGNTVAANGPVALQYAIINFTNAVVHLNGFGTTSGEQAAAQAAFNSAQADATAIIQNDISADLIGINSQLMSYAPQAVVTPTFDASHAQFDLIVSSGVPSGPSAAPSAPALAQPGSPMSTPTTLASSASQFSFQEPKDVFVADTDVPMSEAMLHSLAGIGNGGELADTNVSGSLDVFSAK
jgi:hypothetical protein